MPLPVETTDLDDLAFASDEERAEADAAAEAEFAASFGDRSGEEPSKDADSPALPAVAAPVAAPATSATPAAAKPEPGNIPPAPPPADPYAGMPKEMREALAQVPALAHDLKTLGGRFSAAQKELVELRKFKETAQAAPKEPPKTPNLDRVRKELPEVADAMDEYMATRMPAPAPAAPATPAASPEVDPQLKALEEVHPDWDLIGGTEFALWLTTQAPDFAEKVRKSTSPVFISSVLTTYKGARHQQSERDRVAAHELQQRQNRVANAAAPTRGGGARPAATPETLDEEAAFVAGFGAGR